MTSERHKAALLDYPRHRKGACLPSLVRGGHSKVQLEFRILTGHTSAWRLRRERKRFSRQEFTDFDTNWTLGRVFGQFSA